MKLQFLSGFTFGAMLVVSGAYAAPDYANPAPGIGSQYGLIQNVQNYSSNPFWDPNGPYNQRMPQAVYVQGTDLTTADCQRAVASLVAEYCMPNNNCVGMRIADVRPALMTALSRMPGHNYASACAGYIDTEFQSYVSKYANAATSSVGGVGFPVATTPNPALNQEYEFKLENPYAPKLPTWNGESWIQDMADRKKELHDLQVQNGYGDTKLVRAEFPKTAADLTFSERMQNKAAGYEPFKDTSAYRTIDIKIEDEYSKRLEREQVLLAQQQGGDNNNDNKEHIKVVLKSMNKK